MLPKLNADNNKKGFKIPFINGKYIIPVIVLFITFLFRNRIFNAVGNIKAEGYQEILFLVFIVIAIITAVLSFMRSYSFIPIAGALCCLYLMIEIPAVSWLWFFVWMGIGLIIYFLYGRKNSKLAA